MKSKKRKIAAAVCAVAVAASCFGSVGVAAVDEFLGEIASVEPVYAAAAGGVAIDETNFPDAYFRKFVGYYDKDKDGILSESEISNVTAMYMNDSSDDVFISSLKGIEYFTALKKLDCAWLRKLSSLDLSSNTALEYLDCQLCILTSLDLSRNTALKELNCTQNKLTSLNISGCSSLSELACMDNQLTSLDLSSNTELTELYVSSNLLTNLDVSKNTALTLLQCGYNKLTTIDVSNNINLKELSFPGCQLTTIDVSKNPALTYLGCYGNKLTSIDLRNNPNCKAYGCEKNTFTISDELTSYELANLNKYGFEVSRASNWQGATYNAGINALTNFTSDKITYDYDCGNGKTVTFTILRAKKTASEEDVSAFVERLYQNILNRSSDVNKTTHTDNLKNGESACKVAYDFVFSSEFANLPISNEDRVKRMYLTFLNREADPAGLADWTAVLDNGCSIGHIFQGFTQSNEFTEICAEYGITRGTWEPTENRDKSSKLTAFVSRLYTKAMGRAYDVNGLNDHTGSYLANHDLYQLAYNFIFSQEFLDKNLSNEEFVDVMYRTFFDREADPAGKADWLDRMANQGYTREDVLAGFVGSQECIDLVARFGI